MAVFDYVVEDLKKTDSMMMVHSNSALEPCSVLSIRCLLSFADIARGDPLTGAVGQLGVAGAGDGGVGGENVPVQRAARQAEPRAGRGGGYTARTRNLIKPSKRHARPTAAQDVV